MQTTDWKEKSKGRAKETKQLKKRIRELIHSRDVWKDKATIQKKRADDLEWELKKIKDKLNGIIK